MTKVTFATTPAELKNTQDCHQPKPRGEHLREWQISQSPYPGDVGNLPSPPEYFTDNMYAQGVHIDLPREPIYAPPSPPPPPQPPRPTIIAGQTQFTPSASKSSSDSFDGKMEYDKNLPTEPNDQFYNTYRSDSPPPPERPPRPALGSVERAFYSDVSPKPSPPPTEDSRSKIGPDVTAEDSRNTTAIISRDEQREQQASSTGTTPDPPTATAAAAAGGKKSFQDRMYRWSNKAGIRVNRVTNKLGSEAWWPMPLDKECDKCARILRSFVKDGVYTPTSPSSSSSSTPFPSATSPTPDSIHYPGPKQSPTQSPDPTKKTLIKIPQSVLQNAKGLAIFTSFRTGGPQIGGAGGSGIVTIRLPDGSWSPPSGILPNNLSFGFMLGFDIYDCVCVLNTDAAVDAFTKRARVSLGGDIAMVAGPVGTAAQFDKGFGGVKGLVDKPVWCYVKSRGFYAGVSVDGTVVVERPDANGMFYGEKGIRPERILRGDVKAWDEERRAEDGSRMWPEGARVFMKTLKEAEGKGDGDSDMIVVTKS